MNSSSALALLQCYSDSDNENEETEAEKVIKTEPSVTGTCCEHGTLLQETPEEPNSGCSTIKPESVSPGSNSNVKLEDISEETKSHKEAFSVETCGKDVSILPENPKRAVTEETEAEKVIKTELSVMETCSENETLQEKPEEQNSGCSTIEPESVKPGSNSNEKLQDVSEETESQKEAFFVETCVKDVSILPESPKGAVIDPTLYRVHTVGDSESDSSSDESDHNVSVVSIVDIADDIEDDEGDERDENQATKKKSRMLEALGIIDLPPIEDLTITVPHEECIPIGKISNIIDTLAIISANKGTPAIDLDSVLFLEQGSKTLGRVFDVFGPVSEPLYMVRFNTTDDIVNKEIKIGLDVFYAPRTRHTAFVFLDSLIKMRGSDASWEHDQEPPEGCLDYSDDEEERRAKAALRMKKSGASGDQQTVTNSRKNKRQRPDHPRHPATQRGQRPHYPPPNPFYMRGSAAGTGPSSAYANYSGHPAPNVWPPSSWAGRFPPPSWTIPPPQQAAAFQATDPTFGPSWTIPPPQQEQQAATFQATDPTFGCPPHLRHPPQP